MIINGKPQSVIFTVTVQFKLDEERNPRSGASSAELSAASRAA